MKSSNIVEPVLPKQFGLNAHAYWNNYCRGHYSATRHSPIRREYRLCTKQIKPSDNFVISFCMRRKKWIETEKEISLVLLNVIKAWIFQTKIVVPRALPGPDKTNADDESIRPCTNRTGCLPGAGIRCNPKM